MAVAELAPPSSPLLVDGMSDEDRVVAFRRHVQDRGLKTMEYILPLLLNLKGDPYTIRNHFPFEPLFRTELPKKVVVKTGRQLSKTSTMASQSIVFSASVPHTTTLFITPLSEQIRRFSTNYVRPFIEQSPVRDLLMNSSTEKNVLQRSFTNHSKMIFSFALLDAERVRGVWADVIKYDEIQNMLREHLPVIEECIAHSTDWACQQYFGTPKTLDNILDCLWHQSSQAEWCIKCAHCGRWNIPSREFHLEKMIGPWSADISEARPGTICWKCRLPISPRTGQWIHKYGARQTTFPGYHISQIIIPHHYAHPTRWGTLLEKRENLPPTKFWNEVLGEAYDVGSKLVNLTDLQAAATLPWANAWRDPDGDPGPDGEAMLAAAAECRTLVLGVDWGGGGKEEVSYTTLALIGFLPDGSLRVLWGKKLLSPHDHVGEAIEIRKWALRLGPQWIAHDYTGAGDVRETVLVQAGMPLDRLLAIRYVRAAAHNIFKYVPPSKTNPRGHFSCDRTRTLSFTCNSLKLGLLRTFAYDYVSDDNPGLLRHFLALMDIKVETGAAGGIYFIRRQEGFSDDFAHAVNLGCAACWHINQAWPRFAELAGLMNITPEQMRAATGTFD